MGEFVVNVVDDDTARQMNVTSGDYPPEVDEFAMAGTWSAVSCASCLSARIISWSVR
jgi:flavin reductase (DIM6/NTAB) family NADH-FMN oxidoreductase RutF